MRHFITIFIWLAVTFYASGKTRMIVMSDIGGSDPDDIQSMIHLMVELDRVDLEGIISQHAWVPYGTGAKNLINNIIDKYECVLPNLQIHSSDFPSAGYLRSIVKMGQSEAAMKGVGEKKDSEGSEWIIEVVDRDDPRPVWISAWSGLNTLAQALLKVRQTRSKEAVDKFVNKLRVYDVLGQDDAGAWIAKNFPNLIYIRNKEIYGWAPSDSWTKAHIQGIGPLGELYPDRIWATEGDSPAFMYCLDNGLNDSEHPDYGGWGGRFRMMKSAGIRGMDWVKRNGLDETQYDPYFMIPSVPNGIHEIIKWKDAIYNDFAARMQWSATPFYSGANHHPCIVVDKDTTMLNVHNSYDPDGDKLTYRWNYIKDISPNNTHLVLELTDNGTPELTSYKHFILPADKENLRHRILISTDIGGTDPDDNQSMIHLLMYANEFDIEGLISSPSFGEGSKNEILRMLDMYEQDFPKLTENGEKTIKNYNKRRFPNAEALRTITKQGCEDTAPLCGYSKPTEGSEWIIKSARKADARPLWILVWGTLDDVAQALHDAPDIAGRIRIYWIGGPNKKWGVNAYNYIATSFPDIWIIENNSTYRGFIGSSKDKSIYGYRFWDTFMKDAGVMGNDFINYYNGIAKMGDTPSLLYLMNGDAEKPDSPHWGGCFELMQKTPKFIIRGALCEKDTIPAYSVMEWCLKGPDLGIPSDSVCFTLNVDKQHWNGYHTGNGIYVVRYAAKAPAKLTYTITSPLPGFPVHNGIFIVGKEWPAADKRNYTSKNIKYVPINLGRTWFTDCQDYNGQWQGESSISCWRNDIMKDWSIRLKWLK